MRRTVCLLLSLALLGAAASTWVGAQSMAKMDGPAVKLDNLSAKTFGYWQQEKNPPKPAVYQFLLPKELKGKKEDSAVLTITPITTTEKAAFDELRSYMEAPAGKKVVDRVTKIKTAGAGEVDQLYLYGTYLDKSSGAVKKKETTRILAVVLPSKEKKYLITLIGPSLAVGVNQGNFVNWVKAFK